MEPFESARSRRSGDTTESGDDGEVLTRSWSTSYVPVAAALSRASKPPDLAGVENTAEEAARSSAREADEANSKRIDEYAGYLIKVPEFGRLLDVERRQMASLMTEVKYPRGHTISRQGDVSNAFLVLVEGSVRILQNGSEVACLDANREVGIVPHFGEKALFLHEPWGFTAIVASETATVLALDRKSTMELGFLETPQQTPQAAHGFTREDDGNSEEGDDLDAPAHGAGGQRDSVESSGDPFAMDDSMGGGVARSGGQRFDGKQDTAYLDNKLWALGMSYEQLAKSKLKKSRNQMARLSKWPPWRLQLYHVNHHWIAKTGFAVCILLNTACISVIVSYPPGQSDYFVQGTNFYKFVFAADVAARIVTRAKDHWSRWLFFDLFLLVIAMIELMLSVVKPHSRAVPVLGSLQGIRLVRFLKLLKTKMAPLRIILTALGSGLPHVLSAGFFVGMIWLLAAIGFTALLGHATSDDPQVQHALDHFSSTGRSLLSALEMTVGGMCWGSTIFDPLMSSDKLSWHFGGLAVLVLVILSSFLIWNLVLGIYVRQVTLISKAIEDEEEKEVLFNSERNAKKMRTMMQAFDLDQDGCINRKELKLLLEDSNIMSLMRLGEQEVRVLHASLDAEGNGRVSISDLLFGVLKLTGVSKTLDMLSIDYRQQALMRCITQLEKSSAVQLDALGADLSALYAYTEHLDKQIQALHRSVAKAKAELMIEIETLGRLAERERVQALQNQILLDARRKQENGEVRSKISAQLDSLQAEIEHLSQERQLQYLTSGRGIEVAAIRKAVRERLDREVGPWLDRELASLKLTG